MGGRKVVVALGSFCYGLFLSPALPAVPLAPRPELVCKTKK